MSARLQTRLESLQSQKRSGFVPFIMAGDGGMNTTNTLLSQLPSHGADIIELGIPFSDPTADGPTIQAAGLRALKHGFKLKALFESIANFRQADDATPLILMGYANPIFHYGIERFMQDASQAGADGLIIVDIPAEERTPYVDAARAHELDVIALIAPTSLHTRLPIITQNMSGFLYYIAIKGITGTHSADYTTLKDDIAVIRRASNLPVAVGFGIRTAEDVAQVSPYADLVVVGSAIVTLMENQRDAVTREVLQLCRNLADGIVVSN